MSVGASTSPLRIAVAAEALTRWKSPRETLEIIRALGCGEVQLCASLFPSTIGLSVPEAWELRRQLDALGLRGDTMSTFPYRVSPERYVDFLSRVIRVAPVLDLRVMNVYLMPFLRPGKDDATAIADFAGALRGLLDDAGECNLRMSLEPEYFDPSRDVAGLRRILDAVGHHPQFAITYDPCNLYQGGEEAFPYAYDELRARIVHVHLKNGGVFSEERHPADEKAFPFAAPFAHRSMRWGPLAEGALNIHGILARLVRDGYRDVTVLEPHACTLDKQIACLTADLALVRKTLAGIAAD